MNCPDSSHTAQFLFCAYNMPGFADAKTKKFLVHFDMMALPQLFALM